MNTEYRKRLAERVKKTRAAAHNRVVKDGTIQFRLDRENMERLLKLADARRTGAGVLSRMWVLERLNIETSWGANVPPGLVGEAAASPGRVAPLTPEEIVFLRAMLSELRGAWANMVVRSIPSYQSSDKPLNYGSSESTPDLFIKKMPKRTKNK